MEAHGGVQQLRSLPAGDGDGRIKDGVTRSVDALAEALGYEQQRRHEIEVELTRVRAELDRERARRHEVEQTAETTAKLLADALTAQQVAERARTEAEQAVRILYAERVAIPHVPAPRRRHHTLRRMTRPVRHLFR